MRIHALKLIGNGSVRTQCDLRWSVGSVPEGHLASVLLAEITCPACTAAPK